jgi:hypothetical protein
MYHKVRICAIPIISFCIVLAIIVSGCCISGCHKGKDGANFTSSTPDTTLAWDAPMTYTDGSALLDLQEYRVYYSTSPNPYTAGTYYPVSAPITSVKVKDVISQGTGTYYFVVTAVDSGDRESDPSNVESRYLN